MGDSYLLSSTERDSSGHFECPRNIFFSLWVDGGKLHCFLPWKPAYASLPASLPSSLSLYIIVFQRMCIPVGKMLDSIEVPLLNSPPLLQGFLLVFPTGPHKTMFEISEDDLESSLQTCFGITSHRYNRQLLLQ